MRLWILFIVTTSLGVYSVDDTSLVKASVDTAIAGIGAIPIVGPFVGIFTPFTNLLFESGPRRNVEIEIFQKGIHQISHQLTASFNSLKYAIGITIVKQVQDNARNLMQNMKDIFEEDTLNSTQTAINTFLTECKKKEPYQDILTMNNQWTEVLQLAVDNGDYPSKKTVESTKRMMANILNELTIVFLAQQYFNGKKEERDTKIGKLSRKLDEMRENEERFLKNIPDSYDHTKYWKPNIMQEIVDEAMIGYDQKLQRGKADALKAFMSDVYIPPGSLICALTFSHDRSKASAQRIRVLPFVEDNPFSFHHIRKDITLLGTSKNAANRHNATTIGQSFYTFLQGGGNKCFNRDMTRFLNYAKNNRLHVVIQADGSFAEDTTFECIGSATVYTARGECKQYGFFKDYTAHSDYYIIPF